MFQFGNYKNCLKASQLNSEVKYLEKKKVHSHRINK